jgi:hypothetical protein
MNAVFDWGVLGSVIHSHQDLTQNSAVPLDTDCFRPGLMRVASPYPTVDHSQIQSIIVTLNQQWNDHQQEP